jgi:mono/diheme cytochrome c family protein
MHFVPTRNLAVCVAIAASVFCIATSHADDAAAKPTFARDIAPILYQNCVHCHHAGDVGPMSLMTYEEVRPWVKSIRKAVVQDRTMPPWHANMPAGTFKDERTLTDAQIKLIDLWTSQGAPLGDIKEMPKAPEFVEGWRLGTPDYIIEFPPVEIPAEGPDKFLNLPVKLDIPEDKVVKAIEILPTERSVVHHVIIITQDAIRKATPFTVSGWIGGWAAGTGPVRFPEGMGRTLKAGTTVLGNMHYHPSGKAVTDRTRVGLHFAESGEKLKEMVNFWVDNHTFEIPPGDGNHEVRASYTLPEDWHLVTVSPHMHYRGKDMKISAVLPDGSEKLLIDVPKYDFNWQTIYELSQPAFLPKGTKLEIVGHFNNAPDNPSNPDPARAVRFGPQSVDEMFIGILDYVAAGESAPEAEKPAGSAGQD